MRWRRWRGRNLHDAADAREQEAKLRSAEQMTPLYEQFADALADLPGEVLAARMRHAMTIARRA